MVLKLKPMASSNDLAVPAHRHKFTLIGTPQDKTFVDPSDVDPKMLPDVMDDFDVSCTSQDPAFLRAEKLIIGFQTRDKVSSLQMIPETNGSYSIGLKTARLT